MCPIAMYVYSHVDNEGNSCVVSDHESTKICGLVAKHFQLSKVYPWQRNVMSAAINYVDSAVVQPTASGKSFCDISPPLYHGKTAVVVLSTICLMSDQVYSFT